jgi:biotin carboxyl carrier protein
MDYQVQVGDETIAVRQDGDSVFLNEKAADYKVEFVNGRYLIYGEKKIHEVIVIEKRKGGFLLEVNGKQVETAVQDHISILLEKLGMSVGEESVANEVLAPMPGVILRIMVEVGQEVKKGEPLLILEAMKMENLIKCPADVTVASLSVSVGQNVEKNASLIQFK